MRTRQRCCIALGLTLAIAGASLAGRSGEAEWIGGAVIEDDLGAKATVNLYLEGGESAKAIIGFSEGASSTVHFIDPDANDGWNLLFHACSANGAQDTSIVAIAMPAPEKEVLEEIYYAWRIDASNQKVIAIPARIVSCRNESFGINGE